MVLQVVQSREDRRRRSAVVTPSESRSESRSESLSLSHRSPSPSQSQSQSQSFFQSPSQILFQDQSPQTRHHGVQRRSHSLHSFDSETTSLAMSPDASPNRADLFSNARDLEEDRAEAARTRLSQTMI